MRKPKAINAYICSVCKGSWDDHIKYAGVRLNVMDDSYGYSDITPTGDDVTLYECVRVLQDRYMGPPGPPGPMGPMPPPPPPGANN